MMDSLILRTAARTLLVVFIVLSVFVLLRGHNEPGGGFIGGLLFVAGFALHSLAYSPAETRRALRIEPRTVLGAGTLIITISAIWPVLLGQPLLTGQWYPEPIPAIGKVSTVLLFDIGVYLVVIGSALLILLTAAEEKAR